MHDSGPSAWCKSIVTGGVLRWSFEPSAALNKGNLVNVHMQAGGWGQKGAPGLHTRSHSNPLRVGGSCWTQGTVGGWRGAGERRGALSHLVSVQQRLRNQKALELLAFSLASSPPHPGPFPPFLFILPFNRPHSGKIKLVWGAHGTC